MIRVAQEVLDDVFEPVDRAWRGIGSIPQSGWQLREPFHPFDAVRRFDVGHVTAVECPDCRAGDVLQGLLKPPDCAAFGGRCTPRTPLGAPMVSSEGACAAYYNRRSITLSKAPA